MKIYLIRHGKPEIINNNFYECNLGKEGIDGVNKFLKEENLPKPNYIFSSTYNRAIDTAKTIANYYNTSFQTKDFLREWNLQSLNLDYDKYMPEEKKGWENMDVVVLGNESLNDLQNRMYKGINEIVSEHKDAKNLILVSHGTVIDMFCTQISNRKAEHEDIKKIGYAGCAIVEYKNNQYKLLKDIINTTK
jgi:broad specificity phosphatase PhoE